MRIHCLFEQSGTFKREAMALGCKAWDYDILNDFGETDFQMDLFHEIRIAFEGGDSIFDNMRGDIAMAFFPCVRFEDQVLLYFRGDAAGQKKWPLEKKLMNDLALHDELHQNYELITMLALVCIRKGIKLVIENPFSEQHYLRRYWAMRPTIIDRDRTKDGDFYKKPTQYFFVGFHPENNIFFDEPIDCYRKRRLKWDVKGSRERSMISPCYARRFLRKYIIKEDK